MRERDRKLSITLAMLMMGIAVIFYVGSNYIQQEHHEDGAPVQPNHPVIKLRSIRTLGPNECKYISYPVVGNSDVAASFIEFSDISGLIRCADPMSGLSHVCPMRINGALYFLIWTPRATYSLLIDNNSKSVELVERSEVKMEDYMPSQSMLLIAQAADYGVGITNEHGRSELKINSKGKFLYFPWNEDTLTGASWFFEGYRYGSIQTIDKNTHEFRTVAVFDTENNSIVSSITYPHNFENQSINRVLDPNTDSAIIFNHNMSKILTLDLKQLVKLSDKASNASWKRPTNAELIRIR